MEGLQTWCRRTTRGLSALALALLFATCSETRQEPYNLVFLVLDTTRADHLGFLGYEADTTPNLDRLAQRSLVFERHYSHASRTGPAVASLFTGLHPKSHGVVNPLTRWDAKGKLHDSQVTLAERLSEAGYRCTGIVTNLNVTERFGFAQGFHDYRFLGVVDAERVVTAAEPSLTVGEEPFFLYLHFMDPHSSYEAPAPFDEHFVDASYDGPITGEHEQLDEVLAGRLQLAANDVRQLRALYDQELLSLDTQIGALLQLLEERGLSERTLICIVADHGEEFLEHGGVLHGYTLYEEQLRVPWLLYDPRLPGQRISHTSRHVDVLPTLLSRLGLEHGPHQGRDMDVLWSGGTLPKDAPVFAQASLRAIKTVQQRSLTVDGWKWIETLVPEPREELYHLETDPGETTDLSTSDPDQAARMRKQMAETFEALPAAAETLVELTEDELRALRSLGYAR